jgi:hypothetical protein
MSARGGDVQYLKSARNKYCGQLKRFEREVREAMADVGGGGGGWSESDKGKTGVDN